MMDSNVRSIEGDIELFIVYTQGHLKHITKHKLFEYNTIPVLEMGRKK